VEGPQLAEKNRGIPEDTRLRLLIAGARVFAMSGFKGATMADVAADAGVSRAALYKHFANKDDLFVAVVEKVHADADLRVKASISKIGSTTATAKRVIIEMVTARELSYAEAVSNSPFAQELVTITGERCAALIASWETAFHTQFVTLTQAMIDKGKLLLRPGQTAEGLYLMIRAAKVGLKTIDPTMSENVYLRMFEDMLVTLLDGATR
jgi:AcrR family transcriptional regulator